MKVAIVHDWLTGMRGGEKCLEVFCELFPEATIYTLLHLPGSVSPAIEDHKIETSFLQRLPFVSRRYRYYLPLFPRAAKLFQLQGYDLVLSSSHCVAKNVCVPPGACHISYVYTPMRYVWDQFDAYFGPGRASWAVRSAMRLIRPWLQTQDVAANDSVHHFVAISHHVARRIRRFYGRDAEVVHPPVDVDEFGPSAQDDGYFLMVTALAPYKRVDLAIEAFNHLGRPLKVIGSGQDEARLRRLAGPTVELLGWQPDEEVRAAYAGCRALIFPGEEDFGIVPVEAMASGKPVIAYGEGGALETVVPLDHSSSTFSDKQPTGILFPQQTVESLVDAVRTFEIHRDRFEPLRLHEHAKKFDRRHFKDRLGRLIAHRLAEFRRTSTSQRPDEPCIGTTSQTASL